MHFHDRPKKSSVWVSFPKKINFQNIPLPNRLTAESVLFHVRSNVGRAVRRSV